MQMLQGCPSSQWACMHVQPFRRAAKPCAVAGKAEALRSRSPAMFAGDMHSYFSQSSVYHLPAPLHVCRQIAEPRVAPYKPYHIQTIFMSIHNSQVCQASCFLIHNYLPHLASNPHLMLQVVLHLLCCKFAPGKRGHCQSSCTWYWAHG